MALERIVTVWEANRELSLAEFRVWVLLAHMDDRRLERLTVPRLAEDMGFSDSRLLRGFLLRLQEQGYVRLTWDKKDKGHGQRIELTARFEVRTWAPDRRRWAQRKRPRNKITHERIASEQAGEHDGSAGVPDRSDAVSDGNMEHVGCGSKDPLCAPVEQVKPRRKKHHLTASESRLETGKSVVDSGVSRSGCGSFDPHPSPKAQSGSFDPHPNSEGAEIVDVDRLTCHDKASLGLLYEIPSTDQLTHRSPITDHRSPDPPVVSTVEVSTTGDPELSNGEPKELDVGDGDERLGGASTAGGWRRRPRSTSKDGASSSGKGARSDVAAKPVGVGRVRDRGPQRGAQALTGASSAVAYDPETDPVEWGLESEARRRVVEILDLRPGNRRRQALLRRLGDAFAAEYTKHRERAIGRPATFDDKAKAKLAEVAELCVRAGVTPAEVLTFWAAEVPKFTKMVYPPVSFLANAGRIDEVVLRQKAGDKGPAAATKQRVQAHGFTESKLDLGLREALTAAGFDVADRDDRWLVSLQVAARELKRQPRAAVPRAYREMARWLISNYMATTTDGEDDATARRSGRLRDGSAAADPGAL